MIRSATRPPRLPLLLAAGVLLVLALALLGVVLDGGRRLRGRAAVPGLP